MQQSHQELLSSLKQVGSPFLLLLFAFIVLLAHPFLFPSSPVSSFLRASVAVVLSAAFLVSCRLSFCVLLLLLPLLLLVRLLLLLLLVLHPLLLGVP